MSSYPIHEAATLFPLLEGEDLRELVDDIRTHGLRDAVWLYDDPEHGRVLLDGRNRARACELAGVELRTRVYEGDDPVTFSISQNAKRRHLTPGQRAAVANDAWPMYEAEAARRRAEAAIEGNRSAARRRPVGADLPQPGEARNAPPPMRRTEPPRMTTPDEAHSPRAPRSRDRAAKAAGASGRATAQFKRVAEQAPDLAEKVRRGKIPLDRAERVIRDREAEKRKVEQAQREAAEQKKQARIDLRHGDFRDELSDLSDVDAIITDPPYPREFLPLLSDLASFADKVLTEDGILAVLIGQTYLPEVYRLLGGGRPYRWTACYYTPGNGYRSWNAKVQSNWKPLLVYGGGPRFGDVIRSEGSDDAGAKDNHKWGQDYAAFHTIVERLTSRGQTVCDPFMGAGTTLLAAHALGRHAIGCELEEEHYRRAKERLS